MPESFRRGHIRHAAWNVQRAGHAYSRCGCRILPRSTAPHHTPDLNACRRARTPVAAAATPSCLESADRRACMGCRIHSHASERVCACARVRVGACTESKGGKPRLALRPKRREMRRDGRVCGSVRHGGAGHWGSAVALSMRLAPAGVVFVPRRPPAARRKSRARRAERRTCAPRASECCSERCITFRSALWAPRRCGVMPRCTVGEGRRAAHFGR